MNTYELWSGLIIAGQLRPSDWELQEIRKNADLLLVKAENLQVLADTAKANHADAIATLSQVQEIWDSSPRYAQHAGPPTTHPPGALFVGPPCLSDIKDSTPAYIRDRDY